MRLLLALLLFAPAVSAQPRVARTTEVPAPDRGDYRAARAAVHADGDVTLAVPHRTRLTVTHSRGGATAWSRETDDELGLVSSLALAPDGAGVALAVLRPAGSAGVLALRLNGAGMPSAGARFTPALPAAMRTDAAFTGDWKEDIEGVRALADGGWLALHTGQAQSLTAEGESVAVEAFVASRFGADGALAWTQPLDVSPAGYGAPAFRSSRDAVVVGARATLPYDKTAITPTGPISQSILVDLNLATGALSPTAGFEGMLEAHGADDAFPGTTYFGATPAGRRIRLGKTGERRTRRERGAMGSVVHTDEWFVEGDGIARGTRWDGGSPSADLACDWGDDVALVSESSAFDDGPPARVLRLRTVSPDGTIGNDWEVARFPYQEADGATFETHPLACGEVDGALRVVVAQAYRTPGDASELPAATVTALDVVRGD